MGFYESLALGGGGGGGGGGGEGDVRKLDVFYTMVTKIH